MPPARHQGQRVGLVVNPRAGRGRAALPAARLASQLRTAGARIVDLTGPDLDSTRQAARHAVEDAAVDTLVVAGGDGTVHLGINACAGTEVALGVISAGTGNDIARGFGLPVTTAELGAAILTGRTRRVDAGRVRNVDGEVRWFGGVLGGGFDSIVVERAERWARLPKTLRYNLSVLRELPVFRPIPYAVDVDGTRVETRAMLVAVANVPSFGGGMQVCPDARPDDGLADVMVLHEVGIATFVRVFPRVYRGRHTDLPQVQFLRGRRIRLQAEGVSAQADGEPVGRLPLDVEVVPRALRVVGRGPRLP